MMSWTQARHLVEVALRHLTDWPGLFYLLVHLPLLYLVRVVDSLVFYFTEYSLLQGEKDKKSPEKNCQLVKILWRSAHTPFYLPSLNNYMVIHEDWVDMDYVLCHDHVTLQGVNETHAWFCVTDPTVDVYSMKILPMVVATQFMMAKKLVIVTLDVMHQMADDVGKPKVPVTILHNMGRCGSTMICRVLTQIPGLRVMSEPWALVNIQYLFQKGRFGQETGDRKLETYSKLVSSVLQVQFKNNHPNSPEKIVLKPPFPCMSQASLIKTLLPSIQHVYVFRSPISSITSMMKVWKAFPPIFQSGGYHEDFLTTCYPLSPSLAPEYIPELISTGDWSRDKATAFAMLASLRSARDFVDRQGPFDAVFAYEEILEDKDEMTRLFGLFGSEVLDKSWKKTDSQQKTFFSQQNLRSIEAGTLDNMEDLVNILQLPQIKSSLSEFKAYIGQDNRTFRGTI